MYDSNPPIVKDRQILVRACVFSKITVVKDFESESLKLVRFTDCEFYEIMGRVAEILSVGTQYEDQLLKKKLEFLIDQIIKILDKK